jgi:serine/threonine protein kinase
MRILSHDNVLGVVDSFADEGEILMVTENYPPFKEGDVVTVLTELARGLSYLHGVGVVHGDLRL